MDGVVKSAQNAIIRLKKQKLPAGFQRAEFLQEHGMIDYIVARKDMKDAIHKSLSTMLNKEKYAGRV